MIVFWLIIVFKIIESDFINIYVGCEGIFWYGKLIKSFKNECLYKWRIICELFGYGWWDIDEWLCGELKC